LSQPHRLIGVGSLLIACLAGCTVQVRGDGPDDAREVVLKLARVSGVDVIDARCPSGIRQDQRLVCVARTTVGEEDVIIDAGHYDTATATWRYRLIGGRVLAEQLARHDAGRGHVFDCAGRTLISLDPGSVVMCPEVGRESAHVVARGGAKVAVVYYDDAAAHVAQTFGAGADRVVCPGPSVVRALAPFACRVWRGDRATMVTLTHGPTGWGAAARDVGPVALIE